MKRRIIPLLLILGIALFYKFNILVMVLLGINIVFPIYTIILNCIKVGWINS